MVKEVKILWFANTDVTFALSAKGREILSNAEFEKKLLKMLNEGWAVIASGTGGGGAGYIILKLEQASA